MNFEDLDEDTKTIIDGMCQHTGHIRETAVHNLVELGMMAMVAAYVRMLVEGGEPVLLAGWHREVYDIWAQELSDLNPVFYTGTESPAQKEKSKRDFMEGKSDVMFISLRSGIGLDGLQHRCSTVVIGELDWSPNVHYQIISRIDRDMQEKPVMAIFLVCEYGSDPVIVDLLALKSSQSEGITDPDAPLKNPYTDESRIRIMAEKFLGKKTPTELILP